MSPRKQFSISEQKAISSGISGQIVRLLAIEWILLSQQDR